MKIKSLKILVSLLILIFFNTACEEDNINTNRPLMTALLDGSTWRCPEPNAKLSKDQIRIYGTSADGQSIQLTIYSGEKGIYTLSSGNMHEGILIPNTSAYADIYSTSNNEAGTGQVRVSSINEDDKTISGSFNFRAYKQNSNASKVISNGEFTKVPYKYINTNDDTTQITNMLTANINGESYDANSVVTSDTSDTYIRITGSSSSSFQSITLDIPKDAQPGILSIDSTNGPAMAYYQESLTNLPATAGSTTISQHDSDNGILKGTFFFNVDDGSGQTISISSGYYEVQY
ncbi:MAG: DUF6252 family protein [Bacteroidales bacterium]|jgi:hypothetical protein